MSEKHHHHDHDHGDVFHSHAPAGKMKLAFFLTLIILIVEVAGGFFSHSLALLSDAGHVLTDIASIGLSWFALHQSQKPASEEFTYGYHRSGILAAFINSMALIIIAVIILIEAIARFQHPQPVESTWMFISASVGLALNLYLGLGLSKEDNINVKSAVLHMIGDAIASAGVILGGVIILFTGWYMLDPILSVLISFLISFGAWRIVKQTVCILMEGKPKGIRIDEVIRNICSVKGVLTVHDLHIWSITSDKNALSCHVVVNDQVNFQESQIILREIEHCLQHQGIGHVTIQMENEDHPHDETEICSTTTHEHHHH
ncbi:cation diffusion facilitator family transporter [Heyndrickxia acidicola]|uniref:Cation diffusion facilitator family transporter n=1 Tax=Heyndrickxia acidicola TaxID=209389 RepID=A0ABU6MI36_9BACI|nr:cation diffusion facilitator family transporter [Heyndrickxia acidicola]MED1204342.1 cation diffusion facilitator family transporter [Heyndrickxia acidicola]